MYGIYATHSGSLLNLSKILILLSLNPLYMLSFLKIILMDERAMIFECIPCIVIRVVALIDQSTAVGVVYGYDCDRHCLYMYAYNVSFTTICV